MRVELAPAASWLLEVARTRRRAAPNQWDTNNDPILEGTRNNRLFDFGRKLPVGTSIKAILAALTRENERCDPQLDDSEIEKISKSVHRTLQADHRRVRPKKKLRLLSLEQLASMPPLRWLVEGLLPVGGMCELHGAPGCGKSFLALDVAFSVATGRSFFGRSVQQGAVVYVAGEGVSGLNNRVEAWLAARGLTRTDASALHVIDEPIELFDGDAADQLRDLFDAVGVMPSLIVFDTLARCFSGDENSSRDMGRAISALDRIRTESGAAVLLLHHTRKDGSTERGSNALRGGVDVMLGLQETTTDLRLTCEKIKDGPAFKPIRLRLEPVEQSCVVVMTAGKEDEGSIQREMRCLVALSEAGGVDVRDCDWKRVFVGSGGSETTFNRHKKKLLKDGYVVRTANGWYSVYEPDVVPEVHVGANGINDTLPVDGSTGATPLVGGGRGSGGHREVETR